MPDTVVENQRKFQETLSLQKKHSNIMDVTMSDAIAATNGVHHVQSEVAEKNLILTEVTESMVQLKSIVERLVHDSFGRLQSLADELQSATSNDRKRAIAEYCRIYRQKFIKLLVLVRWAKNAREIQDCQNAVKFLLSQNEQFTFTVNSLYGISQELPRARIRNFDIATAVDVLTTGTYQRLPRAIQNTYISQESLTNSEISDTLTKLDDVIRIRLIRDEVIPPPMKGYHVGDGRAVFRVENEFEVALTLVGKSSERRWHIVNLEVLVKSSKEGGLGDIDTSLNDQQLSQLTSIALQQLMPSAPLPQSLAQSRPTTPAPALEHPIPATPTSTTAPTTQFFPIVKLYDYLHLFCLNMQLEVLYLQATVLARTRWADQLKVDMNAQRTVLRLGFWSKGGAAAGWAAEDGGVPGSKDKIGSNIVIPRRVRPSSSSSTGPSATPGTASMPSGNYIEVSIVEDEDKAMRGHIGDDIELLGAEGGGMIDGRSLGYPKCWLRVRWVGVREGVSNGYGLINPANLNVEHLLLRVVRAFGRAVLMKFKGVLADMRNLEFGFREDDIRVIGGEIFEDSLDITMASTTIAHGSQTPTSLLVRYRENRFILMNVDIHTGRVTVAHAGAGGEEGTDNRLRVVEDKINETPGMIVEYLLGLRYETVIDEVETLARRLGLDAYRKIPLKPDDITTHFGLPSPGLTVQRLQEPPPILFLMFSQYSNHYLVVMVKNGEFCFWLLQVMRVGDGRELQVKECVEINWKRMWLEHFGNSERTHINDRVATPTGKKRKRQTDEKEENNVDMLNIDLRFLAKIDSICRAKITLQKIEEQLKDANVSYKLELIQPFVLQTIDPSLRHHPAMATVPTVVINSSDLKVAGIQAGGSIIARVEGWWACGRSECRVVLMTKLSAQEGPAISDEQKRDHIRFDSSTSILSFSYEKVDGCVQAFLEDWERVVMMANLAKQLRPNDTGDVSVESFDFEMLRIVYATRFVLLIWWQPPSDTVTNGQFVLGFSEVSPLPSSSKHIRNPHRRMAAFLQEMINKSRNVKALVSKLNQTLPMLLLLDELEAKSIKSGGFGRIAIIPRKIDHWRIVWTEKMWALDVSFINNRLVWILDSAFVGGRAKEKPLAPPVPVLATLAPKAPTTFSVTSPAVKPVPPAQRLQFSQFIAFDNVMKNIDEWIWLPEDADTTMEFHEDKKRGSTPTFGSSSDFGGDGEQEVERVIPIEHGLCCSAGTVGRILRRIEEHAKKDSRGE